MKFSIYGKYERDNVTNNIVISSLSCNVIFLQRYLFTGVIEKNLMTRNFCVTIKLLLLLYVVIIFTTVENTLVLTFCEMKHLSFFLMWNPSTEKLVFY